MASKVTIVSDYSGDTLPKDKAVSVKLTVKVESEAGKSYDLDFTRAEVEELIERLESSKTDEPQPLIPRSIKQATPTKQVSSTSSNAPAKDTILLKVLNDNGIDRDQVIKHIEAEKLSWGGKRFSVETLKQVVRDNGLEKAALDAGVPVND